MHGGAPTDETRKRGRPKAIAGPFVAYPDMSRREREHHREQIAERLNDTDAAAAESYWDVKIASLALEPYGIQLVPNDRVLHIFQEWPQQVRRKVSGSVWDGRKLIWRKPTVRDYPHKLGKLTNGPKVRCAHRSWKSANQMITASKEPFEPRGPDDAAAAALLAATRHLATPQTKRAITFLYEGINKQIRAKRDQRDQELQPATFWRPWWQNSDYWRGQNGKRTRIPPCGSDWWGMDQNVRRPRPSKVRVCMGILTAFVGEPDHVPSDHLFELRWRDYPKATEEPRLQRPPPVGMLFPANEWPIDVFEEAIQELGDGEAWWAQIAGTFFRDNPYEADPAADRKPRKTFLYRPGTAPLQRPEIGRDEPFRAIARLWNWQTNDRHREQMRRPWPKFAFHGEGCRVDRDLPRAFPDDLGGRCCRWTCWGFKTCPLQCWKRQK